MPRVTVVTSTYNYATVLPHAIGSVLDQSYTDFEMLVVGDGCTDESADVVEAITDPRVHWHNLPENTGHQSGPNNEGIRRARGDVIAYLGHDDLWLPRHLEHLVDAIDCGATVAHGSTLWVEPSGRPDVRPTVSFANDPTTALSPTTFAHTRAVVLDAGGWRMPRDTGDLYAELDLLQRMVAISEPPRWVPRVTSVKLSGAARRGIYRNRPHHEQAYWLARIRGATDPERDLLTAVDEDYVYGRATVPPSARATQFGLSIRRRLRVGAKLRRLGLLPERRTLSAEEKRRRDRRYKGVDD